MFFVFLLRAVLAPGCLVYAANFGGFEQTKLIVIRIIIKRIVMIIIMIVIIMRIKIMIIILITTQIMILNNGSINWFFIDGIAGHGKIIHITR